MTSDQRTRSAERSGDRVAWLVERMRRGDRAPWACQRCAKIRPIPTDTQRALVEHQGAPLRKCEWLSPGTVAAIDEPTGYMYDQGTGILSPHGERTVLAISPDLWDLLHGCPDCQGTGRAPFTEALELAAYCGDGAARQVRDWCEDAAGMVDGRDLAGFVRMLSAPGALERAALAACEVWQRHDAYQPGSAGTVNRKWAALQAARAHIEAPSEATRAECYRLAGVAGPTGALCAYLSAPEGGVTPQGVIRHCGELSDPAAVRAGICAALIARSLGG